MYFVVTLALKILIYASVNCGFSGFASLKLHLLFNLLIQTKELIRCGLAPFFDVYALILVVRSNLGKYLP